MSFFDDLVSNNPFEDPMDLFGTHSNREAARLIQQSSREGLDLQEELFNQLLADAGPVRDSRNQAINLLRGINDGTFTPARNPGFDFRLNEGIQNIRARNAAGGKLFSGGREIQEQNFAATEAANDFNNSVNRLLNLAGFSTQDLNTNNALLQNNINQQSNQLQRIGAANAMGIVGDANARNNALNTAAFTGGFFLGGGR